LRRFVMMERLTRGDGTTPDMVAQFKAALRELAPDVFADGHVDFDALKQALGEYVDDRDERYSFTWHGKSRARQIAQMPSSGTLRPCPEESVNWDTTKNIFIEGDNLEVLKLMQKSYHRKVKMIYIDPPYNTGKEFIYPDKWQDNLDTYLRYTGQVDDEGFKLSANSESSGRYHTNWLNMMYPRLKLARNLLSDDGAIFVSIDDHEVHNLRQLLDEVFGPENFLTQFAWKTDGNFDNQAKFKRCHEYIIAYGRSADDFPMPPVVDPNVPPGSKIFRAEIRNTIVKNGPKNPVGEVVLPAGFPSDIVDGTVEARTEPWPRYHTRADFAGGRVVAPVTVSSGWSSKELLLRFIANGYQPIEDSKGQLTRFVVSSTGAIEGIKTRTDTPSHVISSLSGLGGPQRAATVLTELGVTFDDYPKPVELLSYFVRMVGGDSSGIHLDFFAGSGTLGDAVLRLNAEDNGQRRFVLVQLPERVKPQSKAAAAGYETISDICVHRLSRVCRVAEGGNSGFRVFQLAASNIKPWDAEFDTMANDLVEAIDNIKTDRTEDDVLFELLLKYGLDLAIPTETRTIAGRKVSVIGAGALVVCLANNINLDVVSGIVAIKDELQPEMMRVVFKDSGFADDVVKTNATQILRQAGIDDIKSL
jgi:adenine-specific DNA-methyltransferase